MNIYSAEVDVIDDTAVPNSKSCRCELYKKLQPCVKAVDIVDCSENDKHRSAYPYCYELLVNIAEKERRYEKAKVDGKSADSRDGLCMHSAVVERNIHCSYFKGEDAHDRGHCICEKRGAYYGNYAEYCLSHLFSPVLRQNYWLSLRSMQ